MLRVAVIGAGRIGRVHSEAIASHPQATLVLVCDPIGTAAEDLAASYGARSRKDASEVFADPEVDAVVIGSPSTFHAEHLLAAAPRAHPADFRPGSRRNWRRGPARPHTGCGRGQPQ